MIRRSILFLFALVFLVWTAATSLTQVQPGERAVVRRFGRILEEQPEQGLYIGWPWGIDRVERVKMGMVRTATVGAMGPEDAEEEIIPAGQMLTGDHNLVNVQASINYRVLDAKKFVLQQDNVDAVIARTAETLLAEWIGARRINDVLTTGKSELPGFLKKQLTDRLNDYDLGIEVDTASIPTLDPPTRVKASFELVGKAENSKKTRRDQALQVAHRAHDEAAAEINRIHRLAQAYTHEERLKARAEADAFNQRLAQYRELSAKNPDYLNAVWLDETTRLFARMRESGRIDLLDHYLNEGGLTITQFPLPRKK